MLDLRPLLPPLLAATALTPGLLAPAATGASGPSARVDTVATQPAASSAAASTALAFTASRSLRLDAACYDELTTDGQATPVTVAGTGFAGSRQIELRAGPELSLGFPLTDATGGFTYATKAPPVATASPPAPMVVAFALSALDPVTGARLLIAARPLRVATLSLAISPLRARPGQTVNFLATGILRGGRPGRALWAHYLFGGRVRRTVRLGHLAGPCGTLSVYRRLLPTATRRGLWTVQFDLSRAYSAAAAPRIIDTLRIS